MNAEVKELWTERLDKEGMKQTKGWLGRPNGSRCCLGVLCDLAVERGIIDPPVVVWDTNNSDHHKRVRVLEYDGSRTVLPAVVRKWAGLNDENPTYEKDQYTTPDLAGLNDKSKYNFKKIAAVIRKYF